MIELICNKSNNYELFLIDVYYTEPFEGDKSDELYDWCEEQFGPVTDSIGTQIGMRIWICISGSLFVFGQEDMAVQFKLRWG